MRFLIRIVGGLSLLFLMNVFIDAQVSTEKQTKQITVCPFVIAPAGRAANFRISFIYQLSVDSTGKISKLTELTDSKSRSISKFVRHEKFVDCMNGWQLEPGRKYLVSFNVGTTSFGTPENLPFNYMRIVDPDKKIMIFELSHSESDLLKIEQPTKP